MKTILRLTAIVATVLMIPLVALQFTNEVNWSPFDFAAAAALLFGAGLIYLFASGLTNNPRYKAAISLAVAAMLFIVWVQLAVGII